MIPRGFCCSILSHSYKRDTSAILPVEEEVGAEGIPSASLGSCFTLRDCSCCNPSLPSSLETPLLLQTLAS